MAVRTRIHSDDSLVLSNNNCQEVEMTPVKTAKPAPAPAPAAISKPKISLQQAARDGKYDVVLAWFAWYKQNPVLNKKGVQVPSPINAKDREGLTALHYAARFNKFEILRHLLQTEMPDVNVRTEQKFTPLHYAAKYVPVGFNEAVDTDTVSGKVTRKSSSAQAVSLLLQRGAICNLVDDDGLTPLAIACQRGNTFAVERLLQEEDIDVNKKDNQGSTALHEACEYGSNKIVKLLCYKGADISFADRDGVTPLHVACREGHSEVVNSLLLVGHEQKDRLITAEDAQGSVALHYAVESGVQSIVETLLLNGADPLATKNNEVAPLHIAARGGHIGIAGLLLQYKEQSDVNFNIIEMIDREQNTPLHFAARHNQCEMIRYLVKKGHANIEALDERSFTPLLTAVAWGKDEAIECLLDLKAQIDVIDKDGKSGVLLATKLDSVDILKVFVGHKDGKELCCGTDSFNNHLLHIACKNGSNKTLKYLLAMEDPKLRTACRNEISQTPLHLAAHNGHVNCLEQMIAANKELIPLVDDEGNTALHLACIVGYANVAGVLIDKGAAVDVRNDKQWTPMDCAANHGHAKLIQLLIDCNAPIDAKDRSQETPLTLACREGKLNCVKVLVEGGADVKHIAAHNYNCLDLAIENGHEDIAKYLVTCKQWKSTLRNCIDNKMTPLRRLITKMPDIAVIVFNNCATDNNGVTIQKQAGGVEVVTRDSPNFEVTFNYEFLEDFREIETQGVRERTADGGKQDLQAEVGFNDRRESDEEDLAEDDKVYVGFFPLATKRLGVSTGEKQKNTWGPEGFNKDNHPLNIMVESECIALLSHPLVTSLLRLKWQSYGRWIYWFNLSTYIIFLLFLTLYAVLLPPPNSGQCTIDQNIGNATSDDECREELCSDDFADARRNFLRVAAGIVLLFSIIRLSFEAIQLIYDHVGYISDWENWIEVTLFIFSILFATGAYVQCCVCVENWQWQLGALSIFLAWLDLVLFMKKLPLFGVYVVMYIQIIYTFLRFMFLALLFIVAFGLSFYMLFVQYSLSDRDPFRNPGRSLLKTMVMTTGEFEFDTIFYSDTLDFAIISYILWIIFIIFMPVLLTNLLVGLAVDDIKQVQEDAELKRLALQVELTLGTEKLISRVFKNRFLRRQYSVYPNRENTYWESVESFWGVERYDAPSRISRAINPQQEPQEVLLEHNRKLRDEVNAVKTTLNEMSLLVHKMAEKQGIDLKDARN